MSVYGGPDIITDGLVCYFDFANPKCYPRSGTSAIDLSGSNNIGVLQNSPTFNTENYGNLSLNGTSNRIAITPIANLIRNNNSTTMFTVRLPLWSGSQRCILSYRGSGGGGDMYVGKNSSGIFIFYNQLNTASYIGGSLTSNSLAIINIVCDSTNNFLSLYINGFLIGSVARTGWATSYATSAFYLGYDNGGTNEYMLGNFYQFAHYNRTLNASEVLNNYLALKGRFGL